MKLWIGGSYENIPSGYTYMENFEDVISFITRCKRISKLLKDLGHNWEMWKIDEINVPFSEVDKYSSLFAVVSYTFLLNTREE